LVETEEEEADLVDVEVRGFEVEEGVDLEVEVGSGVVEGVEEEVGLAAAVEGESRL